MLTPTQLAQREGKITASFLPALMAGQQADIYDKWLELIGDPGWQPKDLSDNWPVQNGTYEEPFALDWHERMTGHELSRRGEVVAHPHRPNVACTLDAYRDFDSTVLDCKCSGAWITLDHIIAFYTPQMIVQRDCVECRHASLLIVHGGAEPAEYPIDIDDDYARQMWTRVDQFWRCVETLTPPVPMPPLTPPDKWRVIDLDEDGEDSRANWAGELKLQLEIWRKHHDGADAFEAAKAEIKLLLPEDCRKLSCSGTVIIRARNRAVTIRKAA